MNRRDFLSGMAGILAAQVAPAAIGSGILMPVRRLLKPFTGGIAIDMAGVDGNEEIYLFEQEIRIDQMRTLDGLSRGYYMVSMDEMFRSNAAMLKKYGIDG